MAKYLDEYLVALGFDLNSDQGKEYLKMCDDIEERNKRLEKSGKSVSDQAQKSADAQQTAINGNRQQNDSENQLYESRKRRKRAPQEAPQPAKSEPVSTPAEPVSQPVKATTEEEVPQPQPTTTYQTPKQKKEQPQPQKAPPKQPMEPVYQQNSIKGLTQSFQQLGNAWVQFQRGNIFSAFEQGASSVRSFQNYVNNLTPGFSNADTKAAKLSKTLHGLFGGKEVEALGAAGKEATEAGGTAAGMGATAALGIAGGIASGVAITAKAVWNMSDGLAQANTDVETMARKLWTTDSAAWQLNNTLSAMGKTTADLNDIAINPTLNKQFQTLQDYQKTYAKLPGDFQQVNEDFVDKVETPVKETQLQVGVLGETFKSNLQKMALSMFGNNGEDNAKGMTENLYGAIGGLANSPGILGEIGKMFLPSESSSKSAPVTSTYAPQSYSYTTSNQGGNVTYSPHIEVNANSGNAQDIASATADATQKSFDNAALLKNVQGMYR